MKKVTLLLLLLSAFSAKTQSFELRLLAAGKNNLAVQMRETSGHPPGAADILTDLVFGICWDKNLGIDLGAASTDYTLRKAGPEGTLGGLEFQQFAKDPNPLHFPTDWPAGKWVTILNIPNTMTSAQRTATFSVCPVTIQELNINYNLVDYPVAAAGNASGVRVGNGVPGDVQKNAATTPPETDAGWSLSPNPSNGEFSIVLQVAVEEEIQVSVSDVAGKVVFHDVLNLPAGAHRLPLRLTDASAGVYQVKILRADGSVQVKNLWIGE